MNYKPFCNAEIIFQNTSELRKFLLSLDVYNIVIVMEESSASMWEMSSFINDLKNKCEINSGNLVWIKTITANPTQKDILQSLQLIGNREIDVILAIGGGSVIDLAKAISAFHNKGKDGLYTLEELKNSIKHKKYLGSNYIDIIAIPSTAGTGSEVTQWATIWDEQKEAKFSIDDPGLKPKMAIIVTELTTSMPAMLTLSTGLDAMCQAIEAYWSKHTTQIVQEIAYRAIEIVIQYLRNAVDTPNDLSVRENLCKASVLSGLAFSQTRTTACHSLSYPLTMHYGIPHGFAAAISLETIGQINKGHFPNDERLFNLFKEYGGIMNYIDSVCRGVIMLRLSTFGIKEENLKSIVDNAFTSGRMDNNPVDLGEKDVMKILKSIL